MKSFHINVPLNMKHEFGRKTHRKQNGDCWEIKLVIATAGDEESSLSVPCDGPLKIWFLLQWGKLPWVCSVGIIICWSDIIKTMSYQISMCVTLIFMDTSLITAPVVISTLFQTLILYVFSVDRLYKTQSMLSMSSYKDFVL